jgi:hypothetical protein
MQSNEITLVVDELNDGDTTADSTEVWTRFEEYQNRSTYIRADHSLDARRTLSLYRSFPKVNGNFKGVSKTSLKFTTDTSVDGVDGVTSLTAPIIVEVNFSIPVGATAAEVLIVRQRALALLDLDAVMDPLNNQLMI